jgi:hypothetical protein
LASIDIVQNSMTQKQVSFLVTVDFMLQKYKKITLKWVDFTFFLGNETFEKTSVTNKNVVRLLFYYLCKRKEIAKDLR